MSKPTVIIHNVSTNEVIEREMTDTEFAAYEADQAVQAEAEATATAKAAQRRAILEDLNITEEEARILLGGN